jgi:hypothetical protein
MTLKNFPSACLESTRYQYVISDIDSKEKDLMKTAWSLICKWLTEAADTIYEWPLGKNGEIKRFRIFLYDVRSDKVGLNKILNHKGHTATLFCQFCRTSKNESCDIHKDYNMLGSR